MLVVIKIDFPYDYKKKIILKFEFSNMVFVDAHFHNHIAISMEFITIFQSLKSNHERPIVFQKTTILFTHSFF